MRWDQEADNEILRILLRFLQERNIAIPYAAIAAEFGRGLTSNAITKRIMRIRGNKYTIENSEGQGEGGEGGAVEGLNSPPDTPAKKEKNPRAKRVKKVKKPQIEKAIEDGVEKSSG